MSSNKRYHTLFLDRDGVINQKLDKSYVLNVSQITILRGIKDFLYWANENFDHIFVITNQQCIGKGLLSDAELNEINRRINYLTGSFIQDFFYCPHLVSENCTCRKPKDGLFLQAINKYEISIERSWMIGDSETDLIPAKKLGIKSIFISENEKSLLADINIDSPDKLINAFSKFN